MPNTNRSWRSPGFVAAGLLLLAPALMAPIAPENPLAAVRFLIERNGKSVGFFETCRGLGTAHEVIELREGGGPASVRKVPGALQLTDVICTRSAAPAGELLAWRALVEVGKLSEARSAVSISEMDVTLQPVRHWNLSNAWPAEVQAVGGSTSTVELVRIAHEGIERTQ